jgi:hypothetical protein
MVLVGALFYERSWIEALVAGAGFAIAWLTVRKQEVRVAIGSWGRRLPAA